ncbi:MAG: universal stress protein [Desulfobacteraceae bacterium]|jgi:nucleotide-binding universal stress UspA family protein
MIKPVKNILFSTNLTQECMAAFDFAVAMATRFQATIVMLHVIEKMPEYVESRLKGLLGKEQWEETFKSHVSDAHEKLIGKRSSSNLIKTALSQFCNDAGIDDTSCDYHTHEIVVSDGEVISDIVKYSKEYECDLIIMGIKEGLISKNSIGATTKGVIRKSRIPVMVVPPVPEDDTK